MIKTQVEKDRTLFLKPVQAEVLNKFNLLKDDDKKQIDKARKALILRVLKSQYFSPQQTVIDFIIENEEFKKYALALIYILETIDIYALGHHIEKKPNGYIQLQATWKRYDFKKSMLH